MDLAQGDGQEQLVLAPCHSLLESADLQRRSLHAARRLKENRQRAVKREETRRSGICSNCLQRPAVMQKKTCRECLMRQNIKEAFKFDRKKKHPGLSKIRGTCYVDWFTPDVRSTWIQLVIDKWTGTCFYTGMPIEIGSTAGLDHMLPVSRAASFGPSKVFHPDNLVWAHKSINILKGEKTADEFLYWLRNDFRQHLEGMGHL